MESTRRLVLSIGLVASPLLVLAYFALYPAYGELKGDDIGRALSDDPTRTQLADVCGYAAAVLAVAGTLGFMRVLTPVSPRLAGIGGATSVIGWVALSGVLTVDLVAVEIGDQPKLFDEIFTNPVVVALQATVGLHILGSVILGVALFRSRIIAAPLAVLMILAPLVHFGANVSGLFWLDAPALIVLAIGGGAVARLIWSTPE